MRICSAKYVDSVCHGLRMEVLQGAAASDLPFGHPHTMYVTLSSVTQASCVQQQHSYSHLKWSTDSEFEWDQIRSQEWWFCYWYPLWIPSSNFKNQTNVITYVLEQIWEHGFGYVAIILLLNFIVVKIRYSSVLFSNFLPSNVVCMTTARTSEVGAILAPLSQGVLNFRILL